jgi:phosphoglycolate phosphatase-like HAD superfamily hydrolase
VRLLLFDIDGTLIRGDQAGRLAMGAALEQMFGTKGSLDTYEMGGKTDSRIVSDLLGDVGIDSLEIRQKLPDFFLLMADFAREVYPLRDITTCPGIESLLARLRVRDDVMVGLLTGNAQTTAPLKLAAADIDPDQFIVGAFGSDDLDRNNLPEIALQRANELTGDVITRNNVVVVGDTPADVECARAGMARSVAVASGWHSADTLLQYEPDYLFADLSDTEAVLNVLLGSQGG